MLSRSQFIVWFAIFSMERFLNKKYKLVRVENLDDMLKEIGL